MNSFVEEGPRRQHPLLILYKIILSIKEFIFPIIFIFIFQAGSDSTFIKYGSLAIIAYIIYRAIVSVFIWKNTNYLFTDKNIEITEGRFVSKKRVFALDRIQSYNQHTSFFHKLFKLTSFTMVMGTDNVKLEMITPRELERIRNLLESVEPINANNSTEVDSNEDMQPASQRMEHYLISKKEIILISFTSFYFLAIIPILLTIYNRLEDAFDNVEQYAQTTLDYVFQSWIFIAGVILFLIMISIIIGLVITYLRFGKYRVASDDKQIYISKGVISTTNYTIPREKIKGIIIQKNFTRRFFGIYKVKLVSLGDLLEEMELETDVLFPFILKGRMEALLPDIIPEFPVKKAAQRLPKESIIANLLIPSYFLLIVTFAVLYFWPTFWYIPLGLLVIILTARILEVKQARFMSNDQFVQFQTGAFSLEVFVTKRRIIDELEINQSWVQRKLKLADLSITIREKPIHLAKIIHLPEDIAANYYNEYAMEILKQQNKRLDSTL